MKRYLITIAITLVAFLGCERPEMQKPEPTQLTVLSSEEVYSALAVSDLYVQENYVAPTFIHTNPYAEEIIQQAGGLVGSADKGSVVLVIQLSDKWQSAFRCAEKECAFCVNRKNYTTIDSGEVLPSREQYEKMADVVSPKRSWQGGRHHFFIHAGVKNIGIKADKKLFGRASGEELNDKFESVHSSPLLAEFPSYDIIKTIYDEAPKLLSEMCVKPFVLPIFDIAVKFAEVPVEEYEDITFTVSMTIALPDGTERTLAGSVTATFE